MKKGGILHPELSYLVASCGHTDYMVLADKGFPVPRDADRINLGFLDDMPTITEVLNAISKEMKIDRIIVTKEMHDISLERLKELKITYPTIKFEETTHSALKDLSKEACGIVKTGDTCPYANLIVVSG